MTSPKAAPKRAKPPQQAPSWRARLRTPGLLIPLMVPVAALVLLLVAWGLDSAMNSGSVSRNVTIAGVDVSGLDRGELEAELTSLANSYASTPVIIRTADGEVETTAGVVGLELDAQATADEVMAVGRGSLATRPFDWVGGLLGDRTAQAVVRLGDGDEAQLAETVNAGQPAPLEPTLVVTNGQVQMVPGRSVQVFDLSTIREDVVEAARRGANPIEVTAGSLELLPKRTDAQTQAVADETNELTAGGIRLTAGTQSQVFTAQELRGWLAIDNEGAEPTVSVDSALILPALQSAFGAITVGGENEPKVIVVDGELTLEDFSAMACCDEDSGERVMEALLAGRSSASLELTDVGGTEDEILAEIGITELISEATTPYQCCQSRVTNIQLFADLMTGAVLQPGDSISLNDHVGQRTREKGFVESGVIYAGRLQTDVGGGISQFATTIFQAMFYGGLDIDEYFPHTLWFSRYADFEGRQGIESTVSFPEPDVQFTNNSPYPVMIWPTYTDTSLTVSVYSTKWAESEVTNQDTYSSGACTVVDTERLRSYPDGTEETDDFRAIYQPGDNIGCDGRPTDPSVVTPQPEKKKKKKKKVTDDAAAEDPPAEDPPAEDPPAEDPPAEDPPAEDPPAEDPPAEDPPAEDPPAEDPPAEDPPAEGDGSGLD